MSLQLDRPIVGLLGAPINTDLDSLDADFAVVGIPYGVPYHMRGVHSGAADAPRYTRERTQRFAKQWEHFDFDLDGTLFGSTGARLVDCGDVPGDPRDLEGNRDRGTAAVAAILARGAIPIILGGDDSIPPIAVRAYERTTPLTVIQVDAHLDFRDDVNGIHDGYSSPMRRISEMGWVKQVIQIGLRGVGSARPSDVEDARTAGHVLISAETIHHEGVSAALEHVKPGSPCFITLDVDGLDPSIAPGTSVPLPGGLTFSEAAALFRGIAERGVFVGIDIVEHFPALDVRDMTAITVGRLVANLIGTAARRRGQAK